jgi:hypothetical protein
MTTSYAGTTVTALGGTFTAVDEIGVDTCTGCAGLGAGRKALCRALPGCGADSIIWVAHDDPATITLLATLALEAS